MAMGSDVRFHSIIVLELHTVSYKPLKGETYIPLPKELADKKAIINVQNKDNKCFLWCVLRALNPIEKNPQRLDKKLMGKENTLNMEGIDYPVSLRDLNKFEKQNLSISITVLGYEGKCVYPLRISDNTDRDYNIILTLIEKGGVKHYCLIKDLSRLLSSQVSNHNGEHHFCLNCLNAFPSKKTLNKHREYCDNYEAVKMQMPEKGTMLKFKNHHRSERFLSSCYIKPLHSCEPNPQSSYTEQYQKHEPFSFCYYIKCFDDNVYKPKIVSYTGKDAAKKFVEMLEEDIKIIANIPEKKILFGKEEKNDLTRKLNAGCVT